MELKYKRILLKLSGEALMGEDSFGINTDVLQVISQEIKDIIDLGVEVGIVIGAGNIFVVSKVPVRGWIEQQQTIWECLQQLLIHLLFRMLLNEEGLLLG